MVSINMIFKISYFWQFNFFFFFGNECLFLVTNEMNWKHCMKEEVCTGRTFVKHRDVLMFMLIV